MAKAFISNPNNYTKIIHLDRNYENNTVDNLKWAEDYEWAQNRKPIENIHVRCIQTGKEYVSIAEAARNTGLTETTIKNCCDGRTRWAKDYTVWEYVDEEKTEKARVKLEQERKNRIIESVSSYPGEIWKPVPFDKYKDLYSISNMGRLKSNRKYEDEKIIKPIILRKRKERTETNYFVVNNLHNDTEIFNISIPRVVAEVFVPNPNNYSAIRHLDGDKINCKADNLEWYDPSKERSEQGVEIAKLYKDHRWGGKRKPVRCVETGYEFESIAEAGRFIGIQADYIGQVCNGKGATCGGYHWEFIDKNDSFNPKIRNGETDIRKTINKIRKS